MNKTMLLILILLSSLTLSAQDQHYTEWYLQREDADIFVKELGSGKDTVIVIHGGFGANHDYMMDAIKGLSRRFRFVLYDQRGSLLSPAAKEDLSFQKNIADLHALVRALKLQQVKLFCHSMGTLVGMEFARQYPELVSHLVLAGAVPPKSDSMQSVFSERYTRQVSFLAKRESVRALIAPFRDKGVGSLKSSEDIDRSGLSHKDLTDYWRIGFASVNLYDVKKHTLLKGGRAYYKADASVMSETVNWQYDYRQILNTHMKTTFINGDHDFFDFNGETFKHLLKDYKHIDLRIIPQAGHNSWIDQPARFRSDLRQALTR